MIRQVRQLFSQGGDTIVEVTLALAVMGLVIGVAAALVGRYNHSQQAAQEQSVGVQLAATQIEYLKSYALNNSDQLPGLTGEANSFCLASTQQLYTATDPRCQGVRINGSQNLPSGAAYSIAVVLAPELGGYATKVTVEWDTFTEQRGHIDLVYRFYEHMGANVAG